MRPKTRSFHLLSPTNSFPPSLNQELVHSASQPPSTPTATSHKPASDLNQTSRPHSRRLNLSHFGVSYHLPPHPDTSSSFPTSRTQTQRRRSAIIDRRPRSPSSLNPPSWPHFIASPVINATAVRHRNIRDIADRLLLSNQHLSYPLLECLVSQVSVWCSLATPISGTLSSSSTSSCVDVGFIDQVSRVERVSRSRPRLDCSTHISARSSTSVISFDIASSSLYQSSSRPSKSSHVSSPRFSRPVYVATRSRRTLNNVPNSPRLGISPQEEQASPRYTSPQPKGITFPSDLLRHSAAVVISVCCNINSRRSLTPAWYRHILRSCITVK